MEEIKIEYEAARSDVVEKINDASQIVNDEIAGKETSSYTEEYGGEPYFEGLRKVAEKIVKCLDDVSSTSNDYINELIALKQKKTEIDALPFKRDSEVTKKPPLVELDDNAKRLAKSGKMSEESYLKTINNLKTALYLLNSGKMSEESYLKTIETLQKAVSLLESGKMSEESYLKTVSALDKALKLLESGKMSEESYRKTIDTINNALKLLESGKMSEGSYLKTITAIDNAQKLLERDRKSVV